MIGAVLLRRPREQAQRRAALGFPNRLEGGDLLRLVHERVKPVHVAGDDLQRRGDRRDRQADAQHLRRRAAGDTAQELPRRQAAEEKRDRQDRRQQHVDEGVGKRRVEDHREPAGRVIDAVGVDAIAGRRLHPRVEGEDPERAQRRAERDQRRRREMDLLAHLAVAEQHDAEEAGLEEERGQHLVAEERTGDVADLFHVARPVGAELEAHGDAADDAEGEAEREYLGPEAVGVEPALAPGREPADAEEEQDPTEADRDRREEDVESDVGGELHSRHQQGVHPSAVLAVERAQARHGRHLASDRRSVPAATIGR